MNKFCTNCGATIEKNQEKCLNCGKVLILKTEPIHETRKAVGDEEPIENKPKKTSTVNKSRVLAGILGILFGTYGVHNFYLGNKDKGTTQLLFGVLGFIFFPFALISNVWGIIEGIFLLSGKINKDADGNPLT